MRVNRGLVAAVSVAALVASACSSGGGSSPKAASSAPSASVLSTASVGPSSAASGSPAASASAASTFYMRWWMDAPVGPEQIFSTAPVVISDGKLLSTQYPAADADTFPLFNQTLSQTITANGIAKIEAEAQSDGLLGSTTTFECPHDASAEPSVGGGVDRVVLTIDGVSHELSGSCAYETPTPAPGGPTPGTWGAYAKFWDLLNDPTTWLGAELGPQTPYDPDGLMVLADVVPADAPPPTSVAQWPLGPFATFGSTFETDARCAEITGTDASTLLAIIKPLNSDAVFTDTAGDQRTLTVRGIMPGEASPCN